MTMISADRMKSVRIAPLILSFSKRHQVDRGVGQRLRQFGVPRGLVVAWRAGTCARASRSPRSRGRRRRPSAAASTAQGAKRADGQRRRHQDRLVHQRTLGHRPDHRQLAVGATRRRPAAHSAPGRRPARRRSSWSRPWSARRRRRARWRCRRAGRAGWWPWADCPVWSGSPHDTAATATRRRVLQQAER